MFKFQSTICNGCDNAIMMSFDITNIAILNIYSADYCCIGFGISKSEAINLLKNTYLSKKVDHCKI